MDWKKRLLVLGNLVMLLVFASTWAFAQESFKFHRVQPGETVFSISRMYNITQEDFYKYNPESRQSLKVGDVVMVPASLSPKPEAVDTNKFHIHIVQEGQTLYGISRQYNVPIDLITVHNPDIKEQVIIQGMRLIIPKNPKLAPIQSPVEVTEESTPDGFHRVKPGESLFSIARIYQLTVSELLKLNQLTDSIIKPGQILRVSPPATNGKNNASSQATNTQSADSVRFTMHRVEEGETVSALARKYGVKNEDIERYNPELRLMNLKTGMLLLIPIKIEKDAGTQSPISKDSTDISTEVSEISTIEYVNYFNLIGKRRLRISLILPLSTDRNGRDLSPSDIVGMDYYVGVRSALEVLQNQGYQLVLNTVDFAENSSDFSGLNARVKGSDIIIGPFVPQQAKAFLENFSDAGKVPVILPFGAMNSTLEGAVWIQESEELELRTLASAIQTYYANQPVFLVYSEKDAKGNQLTDRFRKYLTTKSIQEILLTSGLQGLSAINESPDPKVVVFFVEDNFLSSQFIDRMRRNKSNTVVISRKVLENPLLEPRYLNQVNFLVIAPRYVHHSHPLVQSAAESIAAQHKLEANDIMLYAFQTTYDMIKSLTDTRHKTEFIQIKSTRRKGIFQNDAVQILTARNYKLIPLTNAMNQNQ